MSNWPSRKSEKEERLRIFSIVCEGKSEKKYFEKYKKRFCNLQIDLPDPRCTDPKSLVEFAKKRMKQLELDIGVGDQVWCVFDVDDSSQTEIDEAVKLAGRNRINIALSNPCYELWCLLHFG